MLLYGYCLCSAPNEIKVLINGTVGGRSNAPSKAEVREMLSQGHYSCPAPSKENAFVAVLCRKQYGIKAKRREMLLYRTAFDNATTGHYFRPCRI